MKRRPCSNNVCVCLSLSHSLTRSLRPHALVAQGLMH
jgi:hypothetical protein